MTVRNEETVKKSKIKKPWNSLLIRTAAKEKLKIFIWYIIVALL